MRVIGFLLVVIAVFSIFCIVVTVLRRLFDKHWFEPEIFEPLLKIADKPIMIAKIPENDTRIPDSNAGAPDEASGMDRDDRYPAIHRGQSR